MADELEKLQRLHRSGALSEAEFAAAKRHLLEQGSSVRDNSIGRAANRYVSFQVVAGVVGLALFLIFLFAFIVPAMSRTTDPTPPSLPGFHQPQVTITFP
jgi:hypothetical protein